MTTPTIVTSSTGSIAIAYDYSPYLERIATSLETLATLASTTGIRNNNPYDWAPGVDMYEWYIRQGNQLTTGSYTATNFTKFVQAVESLTDNLPKFK